MRETTNDENLAVMYAQLLWMVHGKARARDALELYSKAVEFAPHDADTYRILGTETISMLGEVGEDGGSRWCQVISLFETSVSLERNPTRLPQVQALLQKARAKCAGGWGPQARFSRAALVDNRHAGCVCGCGVVVGSGPGWLLALVRACQGEIRLITGRALSRACALSSATLLLLSLLP